MHACIPDVRINTIFVADFSNVPDFCGMDGIFRVIGGNLAIKCSLKVCNDKFSTPQNRKRGHVLAETTCAIKNDTSLMTGYKD